MSTDAKKIRQYAQLIRAGHIFELNLDEFSAQTSKQLGFLLKVTRIAGSPIAATLDRFATVLATRDQTKCELELAAAGPRASSRLVLSLPILVFMGAGIAGIPIFKTFASMPVVWVSLLLGIGLFWWGSRWTNRILDKAQPGTEDPGLMLDALLVALQAGLSLTAAKELIGPVDTDEFEDLNQDSGIALSKLVSEKADNLRLEQFNRDRTTVQKASVAILWPLGLTVLPAFVLIAIVPVGAALIQN